MTAARSIGATQAPRAYVESAAADRTTTLAVEGLEWLIAVTERSYGAGCAASQISPHFS